MLQNTLELRLYEEMLKIPLLDIHSHINPLKPTAKSLDDLLGYHYYTELAHSAGMPTNCLAPDFDPRERCRTLLKHASRFDNTIQFEWLADIARIFLGFMGENLTADDAEKLWDLAEKKMSQPDWEAQVLRISQVERVFLTNDFDDPLEGFDLARYIPCLRVDDLVFQFDQRSIRSRLSQCTGVEVHSTKTLKEALNAVFKRFLEKHAKACAVSLPPDFEPENISESDFERALQDFSNESNRRTLAHGIFWMLAECCREHQLPFDLMIGVNRGVYAGGVHQGRDLFDQRTSLRQFAGLFNAFPTATFCVSVLTSAQNQELVSYAWIFPNVVCNGHWWYANIPTYIELDCQARLQAAPRTKQLGYYSDAYRLEFILPKYNMYRQVLTRILAREYVLGRGWTETQAIELARQLLRENAQRIFRLA